MEAIDGDPEYEDKMEQLLSQKGRHEEHQAKLEQILRLVANSEARFLSILAHCHALFDLLPVF